jgi:hypothetical protein
MLLTEPKTRIAQTERLGNAHTAHSCAGPRALAIVLLLVCSMNFH